MAKLDVNIGALKLKNPVMTASGTFGYGLEFQDFVDLSGIGGIIVKGTTLKPREGNDYPRMAELKAGDTLNCVLPLGNGFSIPCDKIAGHKTLLAGGGVGVAPLLYLGKVLKEKGMEPTFLLGARSAKDLLMLSEFEKYGRVLVTTEDGTMGEKGFVTNHSVLQQETFNLIQVCGPTPMMKAVARYASEKGIACEVSLENLMACGLGACLCCVEKVRVDGDASTTVTTNVCVCKEGPVFNINRLLWQS